jgi:hypothetical protein
VAFESFLALVPTALDNSQCSRRKLLAQVVRRLAAAQRARRDVGSDRFPLIIRLGISAAR